MESCALVSVKEGHFYKLCSFYNNLFVAFYFLSLFFVPVMVADGEYMNDL